MQKSFSINPSMRLGSATTRPEKPSDATLSLLKALESAKMTAVPVKPTAEMIAAGISAASVPARVAFDIYQAMISTAAHTRKDAAE